MMSIYPDRRVFFPCELTVGSVIQMDGWTADTHIDCDGNVINHDPIYSPSCSTTIRFNGHVDDKRKPLVCKVKSIHVVCSGIPPYRTVDYLVETDAELNDREKDIFKERSHIFNIAHVTQILQRANAPVKYKWFVNSMLQGYVSSLLFKLSPGTSFNVVKIIEYAKKHGVCITPKGTNPNVYVGKNKRLKRFLKQNINRFKSKEFLSIKLVMDNVDDTHGLTTDDGDCGYVDYD